MLAPARVPPPRRFARACLAVAAALFAAPGVARAEPQTTTTTAPTPAPAPVIAPVIATVPSHPYTLAECLQLADRNHPNIWAARARLAYFHGQLDEARWVPFWQWSAQANFALIRPLGGTAQYGAPPYSSLNYLPSESTEPFFQFSVSGAVPIYTFGKIDAVSRAAEAQVRVGQWDMEKARQQVRMDLRRAYFGVLFGRDLRALLDEVGKRIDVVLAGIDKRMAAGAPGFDDWEHTRIEVYRHEVFARNGEPMKSEAFGLAALRFMTGVQSGFDVADPKLTRPNVTLGPILQYLTMARLFRADVNMARAGVEARKGQLELQRARFFPDVGLGIGGGYSTAPAAIMQHNIWVIDPYNGFFAPGIGIGARWSLDLWPNMARVEQVASQLEETRALERYALGGIAVEVEQAYGNAFEADKREREWARVEGETRRWMAQVQAQIDDDKKDERALMEPLRAYVNARINHLFALYDYAIALSDLARVCGRDDLGPS